MKRFYVSFILLSVSFVVYSQQNTAAPVPVYSYLNRFDFEDTTKIKLTGPARVISLHDRDGLNMTGIKSSIELKEHTMKEPKGSLSFWVLSLEDLHSVHRAPGMGKNNPLYAIYPLITDHSDPQDYLKANFKLHWWSNWHPGLMAIFAKGSFYEEAFQIPHRAYLSVSHFSFQKHKWYQFRLNWDYDKDLYQLFVNGILIGQSNRFYNEKYYRDTINTSLFMGNPALCLSDVKFYDQFVSKEEAGMLFAKEAVHIDESVQDKLLTTYTGKGIKSFSWSPDKEWELKLNLGLTQKADLDSFYVQGEPVNVEVTKEGLLVETVDKPYTGSLLNKQMYLWTLKPFEGDLYVEFEFQSLRPGGLSLLMVQASGMNREDFMADYPWRTEGRMTMVFAEDVRNYHWEFYREMADMTNIYDNSALIKNPYSHAMSFKALDRPFENHKWHKLQFLQIGDKLIGAIDGQIMVEAEDNTSTNGAVYDFGRIALRSMLHTKMLYKNLKVYNRKTFETKQIFGEYPRNYKP